MPTLDPKVPQPAAPNAERARLAIEFCGAAGSDVPTAKRRNEPSLSPCGEGETAREVDHATGRRERIAIGTLQVEGLSR